jgi:hypothetical protein
MLVSRLEEGENEGGSGKSSREGSTGKSSQEGSTGNLSDANNKAVAWDAALVGDGSPTSSVYHDRIVSPVKSGCSHIISGRETTRPLRLTTPRTSGIHTPSYTTSFSNPRRILAEDLVSNRCKINCRKFS